MAASIRVPVPLHFTGKPEGVVLGGILQPVRREIEVECLPTDIPEFIEVDVTPLSIHDALHVSDVVLPNGVVAIYDTDFAIVTVVAPTVEEAAPAAEAEAAAVPAEGEPVKAEGEEAKVKEARAKEA
jgi:large subunit ribosomal protein L25